ncbi:hypothetical protein QBC45DRAFT_13494 [Copromyces sp. CBS 386.78]|nr:hypothetical protein QBC45DRAFT_13494 [Copromyces sp. CBS 386.78]
MIGPKNGSTETFCWAIRTSNMGISATLPFLYMSLFDISLPLVHFPQSRYVSCPSVVAHTRGGALGLASRLFLVKSISRNKKGGGTGTEDRQDFNLTSNLVFPAQHSAFLTQPLLLIIVGLVVVVNDPFLPPLWQGNQMWGQNDVEINANTNEWEGGVAAGGSVLPLFRWTDGSSHPKDCQALKGSDCFIPMPAFSPSKPPDHHP